MRVLDLGGGIEGRARKEYPNAEIVTLDRLTGWDIESEGIPRDNWDVIFANHLIEHLYDVDSFLFECYGAMEKHTVLNIGTPNLCTWFNRLVFLLGYFPHTYEVSTYNVGRIKIWSKEEMGGHVHLFTPRALVELLKIYQFKIVSVKGEASTYCGPKPIMWLDKLLTHNPNLASAFRIKCTL